MHDYFSETAFGSDSDKKMELRNIWEDKEFIKKYQLLEQQDNNDNDNEEQ